jgi:hypothetical protein
MELYDFALISLTFQNHIKKMTWTFVIIHLARLANPVALAQCHTCVVLFHLPHTCWNFVFGKYASLLLSL